MSRYVEPSPEQQQAWAAWVAKKPEAVRKIAERFDPWTLYRLKTTGQRVTLVAVFENGTVRVNVSGEFNLVSHERSVFGIDPDDLEECPLPQADELLGSFDLSVEEVKASLNLALADRHALLKLALTRSPRTYSRDWKKAPESDAG